MLTAGTLGTASGDFGVSHGLGLGFGSVVLTALFGGRAACRLAFRRDVGPWYWASIVAARTAGTTLGDYLASRHGLDLGLSLSTFLTGSHARHYGLLWPHPGAT